MSARAGAQTSLQKIDIKRFYNFLPTHFQPAPTNLQQAGPSQGQGAGRIFACSGLKSIVLTLFKTSMLLDENDQTRQTP